jgi:molybdopterin molybdotransferase
VIKPDEAVELILDKLGPLSSEVVPLEESVGRVLSADIYATEDLPRFNSSLMDGFAVSKDDVSGATREHPVELSIKGMIRAGDFVKDRLQRGGAFRIMTGSQLPDGADAVIKQEDARLENDERLIVANPVQAGENVRFRGESARSGDLLFKTDALVRPYEVTILASMGIMEIPVIRKPLVCVLVTGNELVDPFRVPSPGKIRNSNGPTVKSALSKWGVRDVRVETGRDDPGELETRLKEMSPGADMLIITGGSSAGDFDFTRTVLEKLGMETLFWKVAVRPGTSLLFGIFAGDPKNNSVLPVFGLPGNPMAVLVCLEEFVRPALEKLQGSVPKYTSYHLDGIVENECYTNDGMQQFLFCRATQEERGFRLNIIRTGSTSMLGKIREANAMAVSEIGKGRIKPGDTISFRWLK